MKHLLVLFVVLSLTCGVMAQAPSAMHVHKVDGTVQSSLLVHIQRMTFEDDQLVLCTSEGVFRLPLLEVDRIMFGAHGGSAVEDTEANSTRIFFAGKELMIECAYAIKSLYLVDMTGKVLVCQKMDAVHHTSVTLPNKGAFVLFLETSQGYVAQKIVNCE